MTLKKQSHLNSSDYQKNNNIVQPLISVITVVYNGQQYLEETLLSISNQKQKNVEHIIVDGASSDGTVEIINKYNDIIDHWISEPDDGIYDAMNKGAKIANGKYISFLNASDTYYLDSLQKILDAIYEKDFDYSVASVDIVNSKGEKLFISNPIRNFVYKKGSYMQMPAPHMSVFLKKNIFHELGGYDLSFPLSADYDLLLRLSEKTDNIFFLNHSIGAFKIGGVSGSIGTHVDNFKVMKKHQLNWLINFQKTFYYLMRWSISLIFPDNLLKKFRHGQ